MLIQPDHLTGGERLLIVRRRAGLTQREAARQHAVSLHIYRRWETDKKVSPLQQLGDLTVPEQCYLMRRRRGQTIGEVSKELRVCRWWLRQMESGEAPIHRLLQHWCAA